MFSVYSLFASNVFASKVTENIDELQKLKKYEFYDTNADGSRGCEISKSKNVLKDFPRTKNIIQKYFNNVKNDFLEYRNTSFSITTSWITKMYKNSYSQYHNHMNCLYSGILYFDDYDEKSGFIEFQTPFLNQQLLIFPENYNILNSRIYKFIPRKNTLIFFPSYLQHRVTEHFSEKERYSLAFNLMPTGEIGRGDSFFNIVLKS